MECQNDAKKKLALDISRKISILLLNEYVQSFYHKSHADISQWYIPTLKYGDISCHTGTMW
jgi:hypothetical protein